MTKTLMFLGTTFLLVVAGAFADAPAGADRTPAPADHGTSAGTNAVSVVGGRELELKFGIQVSALQLSGKGTLIDLRYRVLDPQKAAALGGARSKPVLIDQASGAKLHVPSMPKVGQLRSRPENLQKGKIYTALFSNPQRLVSRGSKVTVVFGEMRAVDLVVTD